MDQQNKITYPQGYSANDFVDVSPNSPAPTNLPRGYTAADFVDVPPQDQLKQTVAGLQQGIAHSQGAEHRLASMGPAEGSPSTLEGVQGDGALADVSNAGTGVAKGAIATTAGLADLAHKIPGVNTLMDRAGLSQPAIDAAKDSAGNRHGNVFQEIGYGGETLMEFMMGDEMLKGLSFADRATTVANAAKALETSPRLMRALKAGAELLKGGASFNDAETMKLLSQADRAIIERNPILSRLVNAGVDAVRNGAVQFAQTGIRTGDAGEAAKEGVEMGGATAALGSATGVAGGVLAKGKQAAETIKAMNQMAENAPGKGDIAEAASRFVNQTHDAMHTRFDQGMTAKVSTPLQGVQEPLMGSPMQKAAQDIMALPENSDKLDKLAGDTTPISSDAKQYVKGIAAGLEEPAAKPAQQAGFGASAAKPPKPPQPYMLDIDKLVKQRQLLGQRMRDAWSSQNYNDYSAYRKLVDGIDDTIEGMAKQSGNPQVMSDYQGLRNEYRSSMRMFDNKDTKSMVSAMQRGNLGDVMAELRGGKYSAAKIDNFRNLVDDVDSAGTARRPGAAQGMFDQLFQEMVSQANGRDASGNIVPGTFDPESFEKVIEPLVKKPDVMQAMFPLDQSGKSAYDTLIRSIGDSAQVKRLTKAGVLAGLGGVIWGPLGAVIASLYSHSGTSTAMKFIDSMSNKPWLWNLWSVGGKAAESAAAGGVKKLAQIGAGKALATVGDEDAQKPTPSGSTENTPAMATGVNAGATTPLFTLPSDAVQKGLLVPGNIDLNNRPIVRNNDGTISTELSFSRSDDPKYPGKEVLVPRVVNGKLLSEDEAWQHHLQTGENLGVYDTPEHADAAAEAIHNRPSSRGSKSGNTIGTLFTTPQGDTDFDKLADAVTKHEGGKPRDRNMRNRNPGNLEDGRFAKSQPGYAGSDGRYAKFDTMAHGKQALVAMLQRDVGGKYKDATPEEYINKVFSPDSDPGNGKGQASKYAADLRRQAAKQSIAYGAADSLAGLSSTAGTE